MCRRLTEAQTDQNFDEENLVSEMRRGVYDGLDRIEFVMHQRGRASEMVDLHPTCFGCRSTYIRLHPTRFGGSLKHRQIKI
jgi:hypothetical protein